MSTMMKIDPETRVRVLEHQLAAAQREQERLATLYVQQVDRANRLEADRLRVYRANAALLARMDAAAGYPVRLALPAGGV